MEYIKIRKIEMINKLGGPWKATVANKQFLVIHLLDK